MNKYRERIFNLAKDKGGSIILPEVQDTRVQDARRELISMGFNVLDHEEFSDKKEYYLDYIQEQPFTDNWPREKLEEYLLNPAHFAMTMVASDDVDGVIVGSITPSSDVIRAAIRIIGILPDSNWVSSIFFLIAPDGQTAYTFADCAVIPEPDSNQLATIGADSAEFHHLLTGEEAKVAFLSFSTKGSANHYRVDRVREAVSIFGKKYPHILHDGELQVDAAIVPEVSRQKIKSSSLSGEANVLIFPNLDAGNIAYKIAQRMGQYSAWGPLLQGLKKPIHDLSRGCSVDDIINVAAITSLQSKYYAYI